LLLCACQPPESQDDGEEAKAPEAAPPAEEKPAPKVGEWVECVPEGDAKWEVGDGEGIVWDEEEKLLRIPWFGGLSGVKWTGEVPEAPFEVELEAKRTDGDDFFCGLTVPTRSKEECVTLIVGGWGGSIVGISSINDLDASENQTGTTMRFEDNQWYKIRLSFGNETIKAWIDDKEMIDADTTGQRLSLRYGPIDVCAPFGLATWQCGSELRNVRWRRLPAGE